MPTTGELLSWIRAATRAPSTHNAQPWLFEIDGDRVTVKPDPRRVTPMTDPQSRELWMSLGCAVENMVVAARHDGEALEVSQPPDVMPHRGVLVQSFRDRTAPDGLYHAIPDRQTNRRAYDGRPLDKGVVEALRQVVLPPGVSMRLVTDQDAFDDYAHLVQAGTAEQYGSPEYRRELYAWMRFNEAEVAATLDGLSINSVREIAKPRWLARALFRLHSASGRHAAEKAELARQASALLLVSARGDAPAAWLAAGRALERLLLHLTLLGVQHAYLNEAVRVPLQRVKLARLAHLDGERPQLLLRLGHAPPLPRSPRRPLEDVVFVRREGEMVPVAPTPAVHTRHGM